jgi:hypothetical protein
VAWSLGDGFDLGVFCPLVSVFFGFLAIFAIRFLFALNRQRTLEAKNAD